MSNEQNKTTIRRIFAVLNEKDLDDVVSYYQPDCLFHGWGPQTMDAAGYKATMSALLAAFPDAYFQMNDVIAEGDRVAVPHTLRGTHQAEFQGVPATGKSVVVEAIVIFRLENGQPAELWLGADFFGLMQQLGVIPAPETN
ncbi:MAG: ester cyclase [Anaerolineaceae bacterium]|nr:ester cyclase [Anaerolineaceae bacterium]